MRRDQLDERRLEQREAVVKTLTGAGWSAGGLPYNDLFDGGKWTAYEAGLRYSNPNGIEQSLHYNAGKRALHLALRDQAGGSIGLVIELGEDEDGVLEALVAAQDRLSPDDFRDPIREVVARAPAVYAVVGEDEDGADVLARLESPAA